MIGYKGLDKDFKCLGYQYVVGETHKHNGPISLCAAGLHFCEEPLSVLEYYPCDGESRYALVDANEVDQQTGSDRKMVAGNLKIIKEITIADLIKAHIGFIFSFCFESSNLAASGESSKLAASGASSNLAASGAYSKLAASGAYSNLAASGASSKLAASGESSNLAASGASSNLAASGAYSKLAASGESSKLAASGASSKLAASGAYSKLAASGAYSIAAAIGIGGVAKAANGGWIVLSEWAWDDKLSKLIPTCVKSGKIGKNGLKPDTYYKLVNGEFLEVP